MDAGVRAVADCAVVRGGIPVVAVDPWDAWGIPGKPENASLWLGVLGLALRDLS
jgi:hypothetical protein